MKSNQSNHKEAPQYLLALHSSTDSFGIAILDCGDRQQNVKHQVFKIGKNLSNKIFSCIDTLLPSKNWKKIIRLAVTTGPGGFTGTRVSIAFARTIAQQLECSLDSVNSFQLMAPRLHQRLNENEKIKPFWIKSYLKRRGFIAGQYQLQKNKENSIFKIVELQSPKLIDSKVILNPSIVASEDVNSDVLKLLEISYSAHQINILSDWRNVLPIYPTSPVE